MSLGPGDKAKRVAFQTDVSPIKEPDATSAGPPPDASPAAATAAPAPSAFLASSPTELVTDSSKPTTPATGVSAFATPLATGIKKPVVVTQSAAPATKVPPPAAAKPVATPATPAAPVATPVTPSPRDAAEIKGSVLRAGRGTPTNTAAGSAAGAASPGQGGGRTASGTPASAVTGTPGPLGPGGRPRFVRCHDCGVDIPFDEWPNHRDRLRKVKLRERTLTFLQRYVAVPLVDFVMWFLVNIFFREVAVVGKANIPRTGPVVFYGNHQNQFVDAMMIRAHCGRPVRFIIAKKSMDRPIIGHFARLMNAVPVVRPQDMPSQVGVGELVAMDSVTVKGQQTTFTTTIGHGDVIQWVVPGRTSKSTAQVIAIIDDTTLTVSLPIAADECITRPTTFKVSRRIDHSEMYAEVYGTLERGECIGIFPEGGSHDRTSLLPLKAGVALFTLGAMERGVAPTMVPCGLTYFFGHKFRSRAHIEFGPPMEPPKEVVQTFLVDKRAASGPLLELLDGALRAVTINVKDWQTLKFLHSFRRLYQPPNVLLETGDYLRLTRRLSLLIKNHESEDEFQDFRTKVENYSDYCNALLIRDAQAATLERLRGGVSLRLVIRRVIALAIMGVILVPFAVISLPIGIAARILSDGEAKTALSGSTVKVVAADVKASYKLITCFALVPLVFTAVSLMVWVQTDLSTAITIFMSLPMAMYVSLLIGQEFVVECYATLPLVMSMLSKHKQFLKLYERRLKLVAMAREMVRKFDPELEAELESFKVVESGESALRTPSLFSLRHGSRRLKQKV